MKKPVFKLFWLLLCMLILEGCGQRQGGKTTDRQAPESQTQGSGRQGVLSYETGDAGVTITGCQESAEGELVIPEQIQGLPVISVGFEAFYGCINLTSIIIPEGVTSIMDVAFLGCSNLTSIIIPEGVTSIREAAFSGCVSLTSVTIPDSITNIEIYAFYGCSSLTSITIPDSVTSIGGAAFNGCEGLTSISIPQAFHSEAEASRLGLDKLWPDGFALPDSSSK